MTSVDDIAFLLDVDNIRLDNNRKQGDFQVDLASELGPESRDRYCDIVEALCVKLRYADYLGALQHYRLSTMHDPRLLQMSAFLLAYTTAGRLYPHAVGVINPHSRCKLSSRI